MVPVCLFLLPLFVWQAQVILAGVGVNGPDVFLVSFLGGLFGIGTSVKIPLQQFGGYEPE